MPTPPHASRHHAEGRIVPSAGFHEGLDDLRRWTMASKGSILLGTIGQGVMMSADGEVSWILWVPQS
jgi:hypothetical protein